MRRPDLTPGHIGAVLAIAAVAVGALTAWRNAWICDDAFISFRYAENLVNGLGLVYNAGERVEGYSNFLWTIWIAFGMRIGIAAERWSVAWGIFLYAASIALIYLEHLRAGRRYPSRAAAVPVACMLAAAHRDWSVFATSGLETSLFTFLVTLAYVLALAPSGWRGPAGSGLVCALAALTRPDGLLFGPLIAVYLALARRPARAALAAFCGVFAVAWLPCAVWKVTYYGDLLPNTYYAKSANLAWYSQGWAYASLYFSKYWVLALALPVTIAAYASRLRPRPGAQGRPAADRHVADSGRGRGMRNVLEGPAGEALLALGLALAYTFYVVRVGGDFMYARLLVPVAPLHLIALEKGIAAIRVAAPVQWAATAGLLLGIVLTPEPLKAREVRGIVDEKRAYTRATLERTRRQGLTLRRYFDGLPIRVAFVGSQASLVYYARPAVAIESSTGLTDRWIARQPLLRRRRVGHEKLAPVSYLIDRRKVHFVIRHFAGRTLGLEREIPRVMIAFDTIPGQVLHWDPAVIAELRRRGARVPDLPRSVDKFAATLERRTDDEVAIAYAQLRRLYFDHVSDPAREGLFRARLARAPPGPGPPVGDTARVHPRAPGS